MNTNITVLIPCKDEISNIEACIAASRAVADEVLVADSGSTDGTLERAKQLADRVIEREYVDSGDFKNWAIPQATHPWVLIVDADERVTPALTEEVQQCVRSGDAYWAYSLPRRNFFLGHPLDHGDWARDEVTRLIQRDSCRYKLHTDHAEIDVPAERLGQLRQKLDHYTAWEPTEYLQKMTHYADQQAELWYRQGKRPQLQHLTLNAPLRFVRSYLLRAGFLDGGIGFHVACMTAYYSFLKQFLFWQRCYGRPQAELDADYAALAAAPDAASHDASGGIRDAA